MAKSTCPGVRSTITDDEFGGFRISIPSSAKAWLVQRHCVRHLGLGADFHAQDQLLRRSANKLEKKHFPFGVVCWRPGIRNWRGCWVVAAIPSSSRARRWLCGRSSPLFARSGLSSCAKSGTFGGRRTRTGPQRATVGRRNSIAFDYKGRQSLRPLFAAGSDAAADEDDLLAIPDPR